MSGGLYQIESEEQALADRAKAKEERLRRGEERKKSTEEKGALAKKEKQGSRRPGGETGSEVSSTDLSQETEEEAPCESE
jgi:hypothetical protein